MYIFKQGCQNISMMKLLFPRKKGLTIYLSALKMGLLDTHIHTMQYIGNNPYDLNRNKAMHNATVQLFAIGRITFLFPVRLGRRFGTSKMHLSPQWLRLLSVLRRWFCCWLFVVERFFRCWIQYLFNVLLYVTLYSFILMGKRELISLLSFLVSRDCCEAFHSDCTVCDCGIS